jgi:hypothetical protein
MKSKQFPSLEEAEAYLNSRGGVLKLWGTEGKAYIYTLTIGSKVFHLKVHENGLVEVLYDRYKRSDE